VDETDTNPRLASRAFAAAGHLAVWVGFYFAAAYASAAFLLGKAVQINALFAAFCAGVGLYLLDRLKLHDGLLDPADLAADKQRHGFLRSRSRALRVTAWCVLALGTVLVVSIRPADAVLPLVGILGVLSYSHAPKSRRRPKDVLLLKNLMPGVAIGGLGVILAAQSPALAAHSAGRDRSLVALAVFVVLVLVVAADAMLCDLDDVAADRSARTATVPVQRGAAATWNIALAMHTCAGALAIGIGVRQSVLVEAAAWTAANLGLTVLLRLIRPARIRDLVDLKLPAATLIAVLVALL